MKRLSKKYLGICSVLIICGCCWNVVAVADTETKINRTVLFQPPPEESQPEETEGAASRQGRVCSQEVTSSSDETLNNLTAIVPTSNYGLTVAERPSFWVYLPETSATQLILTLKKPGRNPHWQQAVNLPEQSGIVGIKLSDEAPALEMNEEYQWAVILVCGNKPNPNDPVVTAKVKRVNKSSVVLNSSRDNNTPIEKAAVYAREGIWHDSLDILIKEKPSTNNWNYIWINYLQSAGLNEISDEPVVGRLNDIEKE